MNDQLELNVKLKQSLSQSQVQFLQILTMTNQELDVYMEQESMENPLLEREEAFTVSFRLEDSGGTAKRRGAGEGGDLMSFLSNIAQPEVTDLRRLFADQLARSEFSDGQWRAAMFCIDHLDDRGYFCMPEECAAAQAGVDASDVKYALKKLKKLEPCGCFAAGLSECLLLQLERQGIGDEKLLYIVGERMDDLLRQRILSLAKSISASPERIKQYIAYIGTLTPRPLSGLSGGSTGFIVPDVVCSRSGDQWSVGLNASFFGSYGLSDFYCSMMREAREEEVGSYLRDRYQRARMLLAGVEQRQNLLLRLTALLLENQSEFFRGGRLRPFTMAEAAGILSVSPSTVTRAVKNKWIQWPEGSLPMKKLFTAGLDERGEISAFQVKEVLDALIRVEDPQKPYNDGQLAELLNRRGIAVSRRTVAKYRAEMGIQSCRGRKTYA